MTECCEHRHDRSTVHAVRLRARAWGRSGHAVVLSAVAALGLACHSYYPASPATGLGGDSMVEVRFANQSAVTVVRPGGDSLRQPDVDRLRGRVLMRHADTVTMQVAKLVARNRGRDADPSVAPGTTARVVLSPGDAVRVERVSAGKTTALVVGVLGVSLVILVAAAASTISVVPPLGVP